METKPSEAAMTPLLHTLARLILTAAISALDRASARLRQLAARIPADREPGARLIIIGGRRCLMMDDHAGIFPVDGGA